MSKRKTMYKVAIAAELQKGHRVAVVSKGVYGVPVTRIGYVDSHSTDSSQVYIDYRWRKNRVGSMWNSVKLGEWDLVMPLNGFVEIYKTNMSLKQCHARTVKLHPNWNWLKGVM